MKKHVGKLIAPIVISAVILAYYVGLAVFIAVSGWLPAGWMIAAVVVPLCLAGVAVYVLVQRIQEIRSGEEDDLSQY